MARPDTTLWFQIHRCLYNMRMEKQRKLKDYVGSWRLYGRARACGSRFSAQGAQASGFMIQGSGFRIQGSGLRL